MCTSKEEHEALFGDVGDFDGDDEEEDECSDQLTFILL